MPADGRKPEPSQRDRQSGTVGLWLVTISLVRTGDQQSASEDLC